MSRSGVVVVGVLFALLLLGGRDRGEDPTEVEARFVPAPASTQVESEPGAQFEDGTVPVPVIEPVPLAISETTPPPGWDPPDTAEEQLALWLRELGREAAWQGSMAVVAILVVLGLMFYAEGRRGGHGRSASLTIHTEPHGTAEARVHEAGHWVAAEREGARVSLVKVRPDGSGVVKVHGIRSPEAEIAIAAAGALAEGSWSYATRDQASIAATLRSIPRDQRAAVEAEGMHRAQAHARHGRVRSYADRIGRKGTIRPW